MNPQDLNCMDVSVNVLKHYGVPGMKWGVRRSINREARGAKKGFKKANKSLKRQHKRNAIKGLPSDLKKVYVGNPLGMNRRSREIKAKNKSRNLQYNSAKLANKQVLQNVKNKKLKDATVGSSSKVKARVDKKVGRQSAVNTLQKTALESNKKYYDKLSTKQRRVKDLDHRLEAIGTNVAEVSKARIDYKKKKKALR